MCQLIPESTKCCCNTLTLSLLTLLTVREKVKIGPVYKDSCINKVWSSTFPDRHRRYSIQSLSHNLIFNITLRSTCFNALFKHAQVGLKLVPESMS